MENCYRVGAIEHKIPLLVNVALNFPATSQVDWLSAAQASHIHIRRYNTHEKNDKISWSFDFSFFCHINIYEEKLNPLSSSKIIFLIDFFER